jgi:hypothetical protein
MTYAMINCPALEDFRTQCAIGVRRPTLAPNAFTNPQGAFDAMPEELSPSAIRGLDALSPSSQRLVLDHLRKRLGGDQDLDEADTDRGDIGERILAMLESANVDSAIIDAVRELIDASADDGTLRITHQGDQDPSGGPSS